MLTELKQEAFRSTEIQRKILFVSHATPEDNDFAKWLASQLAIAGYEVWCDVTELLGGERFWNNIEEAIDTATSRFLFVSTLHSNKKPGSLRELKLAQEAQSKHRLKDFIVPLKIDAFPFSSMQDSIQDLNMVRFDETWAGGLCQLLTLLEREGAPKSRTADASAVMNWYTRSIDRRRKTVISNDKYLSNWFKLRLPQHLYAHRFQGPAASFPSVVANLMLPHRIIGQNLLAFAPSHVIVDTIGGSWNKDELLCFETKNFQRNGVETLEIAPLDAANILADLVRQAWETEMRRQGLCEFELANGLRAWFFKHRHLEKNKAYFTTLSGRRTYRQLVGLKSKRNADGTKVRDGYWHYAVSASPQLRPFPRVVLRHHVVFTDDGQSPWKKVDRMHKARRRVCKNWWNQEWRDRLLAFCAQIGMGRKELVIATGGLDIHAIMMPMRFTSPWTYFADDEIGLDETAEIELIEDADTEEDEDDDETG